MATRQCAHCGRETLVSEGMICTKNDHFIYKEHVRREGIFGTGDPICPLDDSKLR